MKRKKEKKKKKKELLMRKVAARRTKVRMTHRLLKRKSDKLIVLIISVFIC
jgi:hypothetical protein